MNFKIKILIIFSLFLYGCETTKINKSKDLNFEIGDKYKNTGFTLIYDNNLENLKKLDDRSLNIYHKFLKKKTSVKITNLRNNKAIIARVKSNKVKFSDFYNSVISKRIAEDLDLDSNEPYIEIISISENSSFVAKKTKTFDEEKKVAEKAPIDGIQINDLNSNKIKKELTKKDNFSYSIKIADFYYKNSAQMMTDRIVAETNIRNYKIIKLSKTKYRVLIGPFNDIYSMKKSFEEIRLLNFENIEILKNV